MKKTVILTVTAVWLLFSYWGVEATKVESDTRYFNEQLAAATLMNEAMNAIYNYKVENGIFIPEEDTLQTGLIGLPWPDFNEPSITTTLGPIKAKRTSTNPDFAALMVRYFKRLNLREGDAVALNFSGSFPAINIATLSAVEILGLMPVIASSVGASTFGANDPNFTYVDIERYLYEQAIFSHRSTYVSLGGSNDTLNEFSDAEFKQSLIDRYTDLGYQFIYESDFSINVRERYRMYHADAIQIKAFVNVGGNYVSLGRNTQFQVQTGLIRRMSVSVTNHSGLIERFLRDDIPVIHMLNIQDLALREGLIVDPQSAVTLGESGVYSDFAYNKVFILSALALPIIAIITIFASDKRPLWKRHPRK